MHGGTEPVNIKNLGIRFTLCRFSVHKKTYGFGDNLLKLCITYASIFNSKKFLQTDYSINYLERSAIKLIK